MIRSEFAPLVGPALADALDAKGYATLTPVQGAVLNAEHEGRDLRITSQTGSGKTVAIGLAMRAYLLDTASEDLTSTDAKGIKGAKPKALVVVPTRELAKQVEEELAWLYSKARVKVVSVTGGASYRLEHRGLAGGPGIVVGTPGRLLDHLDQGTVDPSGVAVVVFDEADRMLDLGFRDDLLKIVSLTPKGRLTHLCSATFPRDVKFLADRVQNNPVHVEGTPLGTANASIEHIIHLVEPASRIDAIINLLLAAHDYQTLIFAKTRADVADITARLNDAGFLVGSLSGEMEQTQRNRALAAFKKGKMHALVATDVAARGIDVQDIGQVIQIDPPTDPDTYTHRSGRTGRAGRTGRSLLLVPPFAVQKAMYLLARAHVRPAIEPLPTANSIREAMDTRLFEALTLPNDGETTIVPTVIDERARTLAKRILATEGAEEALARLIAKTRASGPSEPRDLRPIAAPPVRQYRDAAPAAGPDLRAPRAANPDAHRGGWVPFRVSFGREHGADNRRLLAIACRRGGVHSTSIGTIKVFRTHAVIDIADNVADGFETASTQPDPRDPKVRFKRHTDEAPEPFARAPRSSEDGAPRSEDSHPSATGSNRDVTTERIDVGASLPDEDHGAAVIVPRERPSTATLEVRSYRTPEGDARPARPAFDRDARPARPAFDRDARPARPAFDRDARPARPAFDRDAPRPARTFDRDAPRPAFDRDAPRPARTFDRDAPRPARTFDKDAPRPARTFDKDAPRPARTFDKDAPKPARRVVTDAPPKKAGPKKKPVTGGEARPKKRTW